MSDKRAIYCPWQLKELAGLQLLQQLLSTHAAAPVQVAFTSGCPPLCNPVGLLVILLADVGDRTHQHSQDKAGHPREEEFGRINAPIQEVAAMQMQDVY